MPGAKIRVEAVVLDDGSCPAEEFLGQLGEVDTAKMKALFDMFVRAYPSFLSEQKNSRKSKEQICMSSSASRFVCPAFSLLVAEFY
ncbi:MAG: hypothetical protein HYT85_00625 [candidate division NC10 bacterium]|nr:hypothetical protein [candidate division NC10 bacterium]MBI2917595.1 hypothetical protein [Chloroflexota bacterium]MBI3086532.1 hypothetical protein [candidate division NC10 bacterium]